MVHFFSLGLAGYAGHAPKIVTVALRSMFQAVTVVLVVIPSPGYGPTMLGAMETDTNGPGPRKHKKPGLRFRVRPGPLPLGS